MIPSSIRTKHALVKVKPDACWAVARSLKQQMNRSQTSIGHCIEGSATTSMSPLQSRPWQIIKCFPVSEVITIESENEKQEFSDLRCRNVYNTKRKSTEASWQVPAEANEVFCSCMEYLDKPRGATCSSREVEMKMESLYGHSSGWRARSEASCRGNCLCAAASQRNRVCYLLLVKQTSIRKEFAGFVLSSLLLRQTMLQGLSATFQIWYPFCQRSNTKFWWSCFHVFLSLFLLPYKGAGAW